MADLTTLTDDELLDKIIDELEFSARHPENISNNVHHDRCGNVHLYEMVARLANECGALKSRMNRQYEMIVQLEKRLDSQTNEEQPDQHEATVEASSPMHIVTAEIDTGKEQQIKQQQMVQGSNQSQTETDEGLLLYDSDQEDVISMRTDEQSRRIESLPDECNEERNGFMARWNNVSLEDHYKSDEHGNVNQSLRMTQVHDEATIKVTDSTQLQTSEMETTNELSTLGDSTQMEEVSKSNTLRLSTEECSDRNDIIALSKVSIDVEQEETVPSPQMKVCSIRIRKIDAEQIASNLETSRAPPKNAQNPRKKSPAHSCGECNKLFMSKSILIRHSRVHTGEKPFACTDCSAAFSQSSSLKTHQRIHSGEKPFVCMDCSAGFADASNLKTHQRTHSDEKPYVCTDCDAAFKQAAHLKGHQRIHSGEKPFVCTDCGTAFNQSHRLKSHQRIHSGEKPYVCTDCGAAFNVASNLKRHQRTHSGERPYVCTDCDAAFKQAVHLNAHQRIHSGKKSHKCNVCAKEFQYKKNLKRHLQLHIRSDVRR